MQIGRTTAGIALAWLLLVPAARAGQVSLVPSTTAAGAVAYDAGALRVAENRAAARSREITIRFARLRARHPTGAPPIVFLPGGPGASYLDAFTGAGDNAGRRLRFFRRLGEVSDVVVLDQRGVADLVLPAVRPLPLDRESTLEGAAAAWRAFAGDAAAANPGRDLAGYNLAECAADVDELARALGYPTVSLVGGSFGSQWAFAVMRLYPERVARAVLSGVEPLDAGFDLPSQVFAALQRIAIDADRAPGLAPYLPPGGVMAAVRALQERFARGPVTVELVDERGAKVRVVLGLGDLQAALIPDEPAAWPAFVLSAYHRHYETWARAELAARRAPPFSSPVNPLIDSGIGASRARVALLESDPAARFLGAWGYAPHLLSRAAWPTPDLGDALRAPAESPIAVLFMSGDWDASTPIENMLAIAPYFPRGHTLVVRREGHNGPGWLLRDHPEVFAAMLRFLRDGVTDGLPAEIVAPVPEFELPAFAPPPTR